MKWQLTEDKFGQQATGKSSIETQRRIIQDGKSISISKLFLQKKKEPIDIT
jgi:chromosome condensin MukBEF MukE localization factor